MKPTLGYDHEFHRETEGPLRRSTNFFSGAEPNWFATISLFVQLCFHPLHGQTFFWNPKIGDRNLGHTPNPMTEADFPPFLNKIAPTAPLWPRFRSRFPGRDQNFGHAQKTRDRNFGHGQNPVTEISITPHQYPFSIFIIVCIMKSWYFVG